MSKIIILISVMFLFFISCGRSDEELLLEQKRKDDSIQNVIKQAEEKARLEAETRTRIEAEEKANREIEDMRYKNSPEGIRESEEKNGDNFILLRYEWNDPLIGKDRIKLTLTNTAKYAIFKDLVFRVTISSRTDNVLDKKNYNFYDYLLPSEKFTSYIEYGNMPPGGTKFSVSISKYKTATIDEARRNKSRPSNEFN